MPDSLIFDGVDDKIILGGLPDLLGSGAMSCIFIVKADVVNSYTQILAWNAIDGGLMFNNASPENLVAGDMGGNYGVSQWTVTETGWLLLGYSKAAGSVAVTFHKYVYATDTWTHNAPIGGTVTDNWPEMTSCRIGESAAFPNSGFFDGNMLIGGIWNSALSNATVETLISGKAAWEAAAPAVAWRFDSLAAQTAFAGTTTQTTRTGGTVDVGDVPAGWTDGANSLLFDGVDDVRQFTRGAWAGTGAWTSAAIFKLNQAGQYSGHFLPIISGTGGSNYSPLRVVDQKPNFFSPAFDSQGAPTTPDLTWMLLAISVPAGTNVTPRYHLYNYDTTTWTHGDTWTGGDTADNYTPNSDVLFMAGYDEPTNGNLLIAGLWDAELSDTQIEALISGLAAWQDAAPDLGIRFDATGTLTPFAGSSTEVAATGATLDAGDSPAGWSDELAPVVPQYVRPDADVTTTGWTTAPLWSKVDEAVTDDADFITSTAV